MYVATFRGMGRREGPDPGRTRRCPGTSTAESEVRLDQEVRRCGQSAEAETASRHRYRSGLKRFEYTSRTSDHRLCLCCGATASSACIVRSPGNAADGCEQSTQPSPCKAPHNMRKAMDLSGEMTREGATHGTTT